MLDGKFTAGTETHVTLLRGPKTTQKRVVCNKGPYARHNFPIERSTHHFLALVVYSALIVQSHDDQGVCALIV